MATSKVTLAYWDIRGLVEPARALLEHLQIPYDQVKYTKFEDWDEKKKAFGASFPNLPYLVDGDKILTESEAILAYLCIKADKKDMIGKGEDRVEFIQYKNVIADIRQALDKIIYGGKDLEEIKTGADDYVNTRGGLKFKGLDEILGKKEWLMGYLTYLDFILAEILERYSDMDKEIGSSVMKNYPNLQAYVKRFVELPGVKEYRASDRFRARPHNFFMAKWV